MPKSVLKRSLAGLCGLILLALLAVAVSALWLWKSGRPRRDGEARVTGLSGSVQVRFDRWGVPHVEAGSSRDLAAALGYLHANDRFVQMELGRRMAAGRLAELFGPPLVGRDQYSRVLRLYRAALENWKAASPQTREILTAYARGVNAWIAERNGALPPELRALGALRGVRIEPWTPVDSLAFVSLMAFDLNFSRGVEEENRFRWLATFGLPETRDLIGVPNAPLAREILDRAGASTSIGAGGSPGTAGVPGSNAWALGASRSSSGHPLLASDPHLGLGLPGTWYQVMLRSPDYEVAGMTIPGLPVVVAGQNRYLAWGLTNAMLDAADVFFEELDGTESRVRRGQSWAPIHEELGTIRVAGGDSVTSRLRSTDRGPLLAAERERGLPARSLVWTLYQPGDSVGAIFRLGQASTLAQIGPAIADYIAPAQNLLIAHRDGGLLFTVLGRVPDRRSGDGRLPEPGWLPEHGWNGLRPQATNPTVLNPADELLVSANDDDRGTAYALPWTADFDLPYRAQRARESLASRRVWTPEQLATLQTDVVSLYARRIVQLLAGSYTGDAAKANRALSSWDGAMTPQGPSALYALVESELGTLIFGDEATLHKLPPLYSRQLILRALEGQISSAWLDDVSTPPTESRHDIQERALQGAWRDGVARWGSDVANWRYGDIHPLVLVHPLGRVPYVGRLLNRGVFSVGGSPTSIAAFGGAWMQGIQPVSFGPTMRWLADTANPDRSRAVILGGQAGHPGDAHYDDQIQSFLQGEAHSVHWSEPAIEKATISRLLLRP